MTVEDTLKFRKLVLAYRPQGTTDFLGREMEAVGNGTLQRGDPRSRHHRLVGRLLHRGAGRRWPAHRAARLRGAAAGGLVHHDRAPDVVARVRGRRQARGAAQERGRRGGGGGEVLRQPAGRQRRGLRLGDGRGERRHARLRHRLGRAARSRRARGRVLGSPRSAGVGAGALSDRHRERRRSTPTAGPTAPSTRRWRCSRRPPGSRAAGTSAPLFRRPSAAARFATS